MKVILFSEMEFFKKEKISYKTVEQFLGKEEVENIENEAFNISCSWWKDKSDKFLEFDNINLGPIAQLNVYFFIKDLLICNSLIQKVNKLDSNSRVIYLYCHEGLLKIFKLIFKFNYNGNIKILKNNKINFKKYLNFSSIIIFIKGNFLDTLIKYIYSAILIKKKKNSKRKKSDILIFADTFNRPTNEALYQVYKEFFRREYPITVIASEQRISNHFFKGESRLLGEWFYLRDLIFNLKNIKKFYNLNKKELRNLTILNNEYLTKSLVYTFFKKLLRNFYSTAIIDHLVLNRMINEYNPKVIVLGTDCHRLSRHLSLICRKMGIKTVVIQHGATNGRFGFSPLYADKIFTWGKISKNKLIEWGINPKSIEVTGNPRYDSFNLGSLNFTNQSNKLRIEERSFVVALSGWDINVTITFLNIVLNCWQFFDDRYRLIIKPHPSEKQLDSIKEFIYNYPYRNVIFNPQIENLTELITKSLGVITHQSTIGIEFLMYSKPVIELDLGLFKEQIPYGNYGCIYHVKDEKELKSALQSIANKDAIFEKKIENSKLFIQDYLHFLDGKSAERIFYNINNFLQASVKRE